MVDALHEGQQLLLVVSSKVEISAAPQELGAIRPHIHWGRPAKVLEFAQEVFIARSPPLGKMHLEVVPGLETLLEQPPNHREILQRYS
eukprot:scaffold297429_cov12-Tisochrysis_lutea.AAC.1